MIWTHGGIDKLEIYRRLGVGEVWIWKGGTIGSHLLRDGQYVRQPKSSLLPALDLDVRSCLDQPSLTAAKRAYRPALGAV